MANKFIFKSILSLIYLIKLLEFNVHCLHEDQVGKFDWRKQFIGSPKFVYNHPNSDNLILATERDIIASIHKKDGSIIWRQLLDNCNLNRMSILRSDDEYLVSSSCNNNNLSYILNPDNGLLVTESHHQDIIENPQAHSFIADSGHSIGDSIAFKLVSDLKLIVNEDGKVSLVENGETMWSREESLASISTVEIVELPPESRDQFGLNKMIVILTTRGKFFGLDTLTGEIQWQLFDIDLVTKKPTDASLIIHSSRAIVVHQNGLIISLDPITGELIDKKQLPNKVKQISQAELGLVILDTDDRVHVYPDNVRQQVEMQISQYYMIISEANTIFGCKFVSRSDRIEPEIVWTFEIGKKEKIVNLNIKRIDEKVHSPARVLGDRGILYKYLNPNLVAIMTEENLNGECSPDQNMNIYLIDGVTGALIYSIHHPKSRGPSSMVLSENWLVYSYYNIKGRRTEISSLELYEGEVQVNSAVFSSLTRTQIKPKLVEHKSFIFPGGINAMVDTITLRGLTNKHVIVALPSGSLLEIPKIFLDPRRPINMMAEHREEGLIPYMPELPIPSESMINYNQTLLAVQKIVTSPAILESTSLVFAYGLDIFFTRVTPSRNFDVLKDDFDHVLISGVLVFLVVASLVSKHLAQRKALYAAWK